MFQTKYVINFNKDIFFNVLGAHLKGERNDPVNDHSA